MCVWSMRRVEVCDYVNFAHTHLSCIVYYGQFRGPLGVFYGGYKFLSLYHLWMRLENSGIEPETSCMLSTRSTN